MFIGCCANNGCSSSADDFNDDDAIEVARQISEQSFGSSTTGLALLKETTPLPSVCVASSEENHSPRSCPESDSNERAKIPFPEESLASEQDNASEGTPDAPQTVSAFDIVKEPSKFSMLSSDTIPEVQIEHRYDFYDPAIGKTEQVGLPQRMLRASVSAGSEGVLRIESMSEDESDADAKSEKSDKSMESPPPYYGKASPSRDLTKNRRKVVTQWGVLVGKAMWCRVHGPGDKLRRRQHGLLTVAVKDPKTKGKGKVLALNRAKMVVRQANALARRVAQETEDCLDCDWSVSDLVTFLFSADYVDTLVILAKGSQKMIAQQPPLVEVDAPCRVFGDIHGQLRDLLLLFKSFGSPVTNPDTAFVFNGDFVDRGKHQLEVIGLLFALKLVFPDRVWLLRGNHEDRDMNRKYGFLQECKRHLGERRGLSCFDLFHKTFDYLPLSCLIAKRILTLHGGIGDGKWTVNDLRYIQRPLSDDILNSPEKRWLFNVLWSDPIDEDEEEHADVFGVHSSPRTSRAVNFGWNVTETFCARNGLSLIVRSHQVKAGGYGFEIMHKGMLVRVFSARDYEDHGNDCAVLIITSSSGHLVVKPQVLRSVTKAGR